ncbi:WD40 repeat domain-containing protein [Nonomuraea purpurea]|uniref:WD40 repeat domain-containing protein n=1 Tax=Nonomuraea purpurea TaxID=1849276 RepID=A0ABV8GMC0_9ACTN
MSASSAIIVSSPPTGRIRDFDLVVRDGRLLVVGTPDRSHLACTWDPATDLWTEHRLGNPWLEETDGDYTELYTLGAAVVDGRIVIGGGGDHQGFAMWDLESGKVRLSAQDGGVGSVVRADFGARSLLVVGFNGTWAFELWDPSAAERDDDDDSDRPSPYDLLVEVEELCSKSYASSAVAAGMLGERPVVVADSWEGGVLVWDIDEQRSLAEFDELDEEPHDFAMAAVDGRTHVVAAGRRYLVLGDPETGEWAEPLIVPGDEISCLDAGTVNGRAIAVTGAGDGAIHVWDLAGRQPLGEPFLGHGGEVYGVRMTELDDRPVVISAAHDGSVRVWELPS